MATFIFLSLILIGVCFTAIKTDGSCTLKLSNQIPENEPVYLVRKSNDKFDLFDPTGETSDIGDTLTMFCPGKRNTLAGSDSNLADLHCTSRFRSELHRKNCTKQVTGDLRTTTRRCELNGRSGLVYESGFLVETHLVKLYEICYDSTKASALYTHHQINGRAIKHAIRESQRVDFKATGTPKLANAQQSFRKQSQISNFRKLLGRHQAYFTNHTFLSRGHLSPDADFIFSSGQFATYFYANVIPQFQSINGGNWVAIESIARHLAEQEATNVDIYTGTYGHLQLPSADGDLVPLYLSTSEQIEVPEYMWKIVHNPHTQSAIVFITLNNPYADRRDHPPMCPDVCEQAGINDRNFNTVKKGLSYCCTYETFSRIVTAIDLNARHLLAFR